jgi:hypothetical protein
MKVFLVIAFLMIAASAKADTVYTYTGNDGINGRFVLFGAPVVSEMPVAVDPLTYFFTAGNQVFDSSNSTAYFEIGTTSNGTIDDWLFSAKNQTDGSFFSEFYGSGSEATDAVQYNGVNTAYLEGDAGNWLIAEIPPDPIIPTPEPSEWLSMIAGIAGLLWLAHRKGLVLRR